MRKIILIVFLNFIIVLSGLDISGFVLNENEQPIENVVISTSQKAVISGKVGQFQLKNISSNDLVTFHKIGYKDVTIEAGKIPDRITMNHTAVLIEGISVTSDPYTEKLLKSPDKIVIKMDDNQQSSIDELLQKAGLQVSGINLSGEAQNVSIPGFESRHTLFLISDLNTFFRLSGFLYL